MPEIRRHQLRPRNGSLTYLKTSETSCWEPNLPLAQALHLADKEYHQTLREGLDLLDQLQTSLSPEFPLKEKPPAEELQELFHEIRQLFAEAEEPLRPQPAEEVEVVDLTQEDLVEVPPKLENEVQETTSTQTLPSTIPSTLHLADIYPFYHGPNPLTDLNEFVLRNL